MHSIEWLAYVADDLGGPLIPQTTQLFAFFRRLSYLHSK